MNYTKKQIEKMADEYANQFIDGKDHFYGFKAGFEKALSLFAVSWQSELLLAFIEHIKKDNELTETVNAIDVEAFLESQQ